MNNTIIVHKFRITDSKFSKEKGNGKCLHMQISIDGKFHVVFTGSVALMDLIQQVPETVGFPFETKITKENKRFQFT